jgi:MtfA peptidase
MGTCRDLNPALGTNSRHPREVCGNVMARVSVGHCGPERRRPVFDRLRRWHRDRILKRHAIDDALWLHVLAEQPVLRGLDHGERQQLRELTTMFLHGKQFFGAQALDVDDYMRVTIAAQACLLVLNLGLGYYRGWRTVLVYAGAFVARHEYEDDLGLVHEDLDARDGETSSQGSVVVSWEEVELASRGVGADQYPGNVVLHEFAHKLDYLNGDANGFPPLHASMRRDAWADAFVQAYDLLCATVDAGGEPPIDAYASENPAEFFAVATEVFFVAPAELTRAFPDVYTQLTLFYRQDPLRRSRGAA